MWPEISTPSSLFFFSCLSSPSSALFTFLQSHLHVSYFVFLSLSLSIYRLSPSLLRLPPSCRCSTAPASVHSLGSTGSETVTQSSLVIGHGHANQTGRNLQLIRILPPAIIVPPPPQPPPPPPTPAPLHPHAPTKLITFGGLFPLLVFLF